MVVSNRKSIWDNLKMYDPSENEESYIEITQWTNGEGWDIDINTTKISLTYSQLEAINYLTKALDYNKETE